jgi:hypothetical protein
VLHTSTPYVDAAGGALLRDAGALGDAFPYADLLHCDAVATP